MNVKRIVFLVLLISLVTAGTVFAQVGREIPVYRVDNDTRIRIIRAVETQYGIDIVYEATEWNIGYVDFYVTAHYQEGRPLYYNDFESVMTTRRQAVGMVTWRSSRIASLEVRVRVRN